MLPCQEYVEPMSLKDSSKLKTSNYRFRLFEEARLNILEEKTLHDY